MLPRPQAVNAEHGGNIGTRVHTHHTRKADSLIEESHEASGQQHSRLDPHQQDRIGVDQFLLGRYLLHQGLRRGPVDGKPRAQEKCSHTQNKKS